MDLMVFFESALLCLFLCCIDPRQPDSNGVFGTFDRGFNAADKYLVLRQLLNRVH